jgi:hypothetical protein
MMIQINILSARASLDFTGNKPAIGAFESAEVSKGEHDENVFRMDSRPPSYDISTHKEDDSALLATVNWIAGVGDVCNRATHGEIHQPGAATTQHWKTIRASQPKMPTEKGAHGFHRNPRTKRSALQRHCEFWDADGDGLIYPWDIFTGFRKLGFNIALCLWAAVTMAICSSYATQRSWLPHPLFAINIDNIHCSRHGSTTATYDLDSEIDMRRFHAIFEKYAHGKDYLTLSTLYDVWSGQCSANDWFGWFAGGLECGFRRPSRCELRLTVARDCTIYSTMARGWQDEERGYLGRVRWHHLRQDSPSACYGTWLKVIASTCAAITVT